MSRGDTINRRHVTERAPSLSFHHAILWHCSVGNLLEPSQYLISHSSRHTIPTCNKMHLGFIDLIRGLFVPRKGNESIFDNGKTENYYVRGSIRDRGPCPALNALANQGYL